ncbi:MAG: hypothetical protein V4447_02130 [Pseudomonadota bacterium]
MSALHFRVLASTAFALVHQLSAAQLVVCGLGPLPGSNGFESWNNKVELQRSQLGYLSICEQNLDRYRFEDKAKDDKAVIQKLSFIPHGLDGSVFKSFRFLGSIADGFSDKGASMYRRVYRGAGGELITLQELSLRDGAGVTWNRRDGMIRIRNSDALLTIVQAPSGKGHSELSWKEGSTYFEITIDRGVNAGRTKARLIVMAESLPRERR